MEKTLVINVAPNNAEIRRYEGGFEWVFSARTKKGKLKKIKMKFNRWWLTYLAQDIKEVLDEEIAELTRLRNLCAIPGADD